MHKGKLFGIGVGPGDPELMTVGAIRIIEACPVIACPRTKYAHTLALDIASKAVDVSAKKILYVDFGMSTSTTQPDLTPLLDCLAAGEDIAYLTIGDISLYTTWTRIEHAAREAGFETDAVAGVPSFCAAAAALHASLTEPDEPLRIIPGGCADEELERELALPGTKVIMKSGRELPRVAALIDELGFADHASMVVNCGLPGERICDHLEVTGDEGYFTIVIVHG